jgi:hypothetical protein
VGRRAQLHSVQPDVSDDRVALDRQVSGTVTRLGKNARPARWLPDWLPPALTAALLGAPRLGLGYFWDDYHFLTSRGANNPLVYLLPTASDPYYRPIPEGLYAQLLRLVDPHHGLVGHAINLLLFALATALLVQLVARLAGRRAGVVAGFAFAATGAIPSLVAWVSGSHDLFAIVFLLAAMLFRDSGRNVVALVAAACALLSKESAVAVLPVLVFWDALTGKRPARPARDALAYGLLTLAWVAVHPGVRALLAHGFQSGATGYVGLEHPERWARYLARYAETLWNVPVTGASTRWPADLTLWAVAALAVLVTGVALGGTRRTTPREAGSLPSTHRLVLLGILLAIPTLLLPTFLVRPWVPYLVAPSALGASLLLAVGLRRAPLGVTVAALAIFLGLGVWCRGILLPRELVWSEPVLLDASQAIHRVERNFRTLRPSIPKGSQVLVSVASTGTRGINSTLLGGQALSLWYDDPTLKTERPELRRTGFTGDLLFRVTEGLDVVEIEPDQCLFRSTAASVDAFDIGRPISTYARGVAASGDAERSVRILERLAQIDGGYLRSYELRLAAMAALWVGNQTAAGRLVTAADSLPREAALDLMAKVFGEPTAQAGLDSCAFQAFNISPDDPDALRHLMRLYRDMGYTAQAEHFASRLQRILPQDPEVARVLRGRNFSRDGAAAFPQ